jgi:AraC-like DNA-binding protein
MPIMGHEDLGPRSLLGYRLAQARAIARLRAAAERLGMTIMDVTECPGRPTRSITGLECLVLDLPPWDVDGRRLAKAARARVPRVPVLVYYADTADGLESASQWAVERGVLCKMQVDDSRETQRLARILASVVRDPVTSSLIRALERRLSVPDGIPSRFLHLCGQRLRVGWEARVDVDSLARSAGTSRRHLERCFRAAGLPAPRVLRDLLFLAWVRAVSDETLSGEEVAQGLGMTRRDWKRLVVRCSRWECDLQWVLDPQRPCD